MGERPEKKRRRPKGEGYFYKRQSDGLWVRGCELEPGEDGSRRRVHVTSKDRNEAIQKFNKLRRDLEDGHRPAKGRKPTVERVFNDWLDSKSKLGPRTRRDYRSVAESRFLPKIGQKPVNSVTSEQLRKLLAEWQEEGLGSQTIKHAFNVLAPMFKWAVREGLRRDDPMERVEAPNVVHVEAEPFNADEATLVLKSAAEENDPLYPRYAIQLLLGRRQAECLGLTEDAFDFDMMTVDISWQLQWLKLKDGFKPEQGVTVYPLSAFDLPLGYECRPLWRTACLVRTKTRKNLKLPLLPELSALIKTHVERTERGIGGLVFSRADRKPIRPEDDLEAWKKRVEKAGVLDSWRQRLPKLEDPTQPDRRYPGTHTNRHTANTLLQRRGVPEDVRMMILGHSTATANRIYAHKDLEFARTQMAKLGDLLPPAQG